jgi:hypothetical protein
MPPMPPMPQVPPGPPAPQAQFGVPMRPISAGPRRRGRAVLPVLLAFVAVVAVAAGGFVILKPGSSSAKPTPSVGASPTDPSFLDYSDRVPPIPEDGPVPAAAQTDPIEGHLTLGKTTSLGKQTIGAGGGTISAGSLKLNVLAGTVAADTTFTVSQAPITANEFSKIVTPLTPLYQVDDGDAALAEPITVTMPAKIPAGKTAMAFSYDYEMGTITPLIPVSQNATTITAGATHFSGFFAGLVNLATQPTTVDSGFRPGVDDWEFPNYGSYVAPGGHCEGQSATAIWYYETQKRDAGAHSLSGLFDNNGKSPKTPDLWADDSQAYRFVSSVHHDPIAVPKTYVFFRNMWNNPDDRMTYTSFWTAIAATSEPQMIRISKAADDGGHTMLVYRVTADRLFVADPNYPGRLRTIRYDAATGKLSPYSSGDNAGNIAAEGATVYTRFSYVPWQTSHTSDAIAAHWADFQNGQAGDTVFPGYDLEALAGIDENGQDVWEELVDGYATTDKQLTIRISDPQHLDNVRMKAYLGTSSKEVVTPGRQITVELKDGNNALGLLEQGHKTGWASWQYVDFVRLNVVKGPSATLTFDPSTPKDGQTDVGIPLKVAASAIPATAKHVSFVWKYDGVAVDDDPYDAPYSDPLVSQANHAFTESGNRTVEVVLYDTTASTHTVLARAKWTVAILGASPSHAASPTTASAGGHWVLATSKQLGGPLASSFSKPGEKLTVTTTNGSMTTYYNYDGPPHRHETGSSTWGPPPASAAPGTVWNMTLSAQGSCSYDLDLSWAEGIGASVLWVEGGEFHNQSWSASATCDKGSASAQVSWTFPTYRGQGDEVEIDVSGGDEHCEDGWTYTYEWKA